MNAKTAWEKYQNALHRDGMKEVLDQIDRACEAKQYHATIDMTQDQSEKLRRAGFIVSFLWGTSYSVSWSGGGYVTEGNK